MFCPVLSIPALPQVNFPEKLAFFHDYYFFCRCGLQVFQNGGIPRKHHELQVKMRESYEGTPFLPQLNFRGYENPIINFLMHLYGANLVHFTSTQNPNHIHLVCIVTVEYLNNKTIGLVNSRTFTPHYSLLSLFNHCSAKRQVQLAYLNSNSCLVSSIISGVMMPSQIGTQIQVLTK